MDVNPISHLVTRDARADAGRRRRRGHRCIVLGAAAALTAVFAPLTVRLYRNRA